jgi:predicted PurR-regulated permease PerM
MKNNKLTLILATIVTLLLGPGAGHLIIKEWRRAVFFIALALTLFVILVTIFINSVGPEILESIKEFQNISQFRTIYETFQEENQNTMLMFNILFAGVWASSIVDLFKIVRNKEFIEEEKEEK